MRENSRERVSVHPLVPPDSTSPVPPSITTAPPPTTIPSHLQSTYDLHQIQFGSLPSNVCQNPCLSLSLLTPQLQFQKQIKGKIMCSKLMSLQIFSIKHLNHGKILSSSEIGDYSQIHIYLPICFLKHRKSKEPLLCSQSAINLISVPSQIQMTNGSCSSMAHADSEDTLYRSDRGRKDLTHPCTPKKLQHRYGFAYLMYPWNFLIAKFWLRLETPQGAFWRQTLLHIT